MARYISHYCIGLLYVVLLFGDGGNGCNGYRKMILVIWMDPGMVLVFVMLTVMVMP